MKIAALTSLSILPLAISAQAQGLYTKNTDVFELDTTTFHDVVLESNHTTIVEFYAPWCGHCRSLKPQYAKAAKQLRDIVQVGAVNCDYAKNKNLCSKYRVEGYPTIMGFRPPKVDLEKTDPIKYGHATENYNGARTTKGIVDFGLGRIKNYVKRISTEDKLNLWLDKPSPRPKVVVFTRKDKLSPFLKSIAIDLLSIIDIAYFPLRDRETGVFEKYGIDPKGSKAAVFYFEKDEEPVKHEGSLTKDELYGFFKGFSKINSDVEDVIERNEYLGKIQKGEKVSKKDKKGKKEKKSKESKKPSAMDHDEL